jgi:hypothetical protein
MKPIFSILLFISLFQNHLLSQPTGCSSHNDVLGNAGQTGLTGEYVAGFFNDNPSYFPSTVAASNRLETNLNYTGNNWGAIVPPAGGSVADADNYSARYRGSIYIATSGVYTFYLTSDDASYLWIDNNALAYPLGLGNALINNGGLHGDITIAATTSLTAGLHNIQILFGEGTGGNHLIFEYSATTPAITRQVVPNSILCTGIQPAQVPQAAVPPPGCSCSAGVTSQYYTGYYNDVQTFFTTNTPAINRVDPQIGFTTDASWGNVCPPLAGSNASPETYSARFTGGIYIPVAGTYTFYLSSDDASYMWIDGNALAPNPTAGTSLINNSGLHSAAMVSVVATLSAGLHDFKIHYGENTGNNICYLEYASAAAGISRQIVPQSSYCSCMSTTSTLPVELLNFSATLTEDKAVLVEWKTASETNNKQFDLERSTNGIDFTTIASMASKADQQSHSVNTYFYNDQNPEPGISYYRLKQIDRDETFKYYNIVSVERSYDGNSPVKAFPNPNEGMFTISFGGTRKAGSVSVRILVPDGEVIMYDEAISPESLENGSLRINLGDKAGKGLYIAICVIDGVKYPLKISVN